MDAYRLSRTSLVFGSADTVVDLGSILLGPISLTGQANIHRRRLRGQQGLSADGISSSLGLRCRVRAGDEQRKLDTLRQGVLMLARHDAGYCYAFPAVVTNLALDTATSGAVVATLTFAQGAVGLPVAAALIGPGNAPAPVAPNVGYIYQPGASVTPLAGAAVVPANGFAVVGPPFVAEGG